MKKIMTIFGTRPEAIKMAPLVLALKNDPELEPIVVVTAQHREMLDQVLEIFGITPDYDLNIMKAGQTLSEVTSRVILGLEEVIKETRPDMILVHGDTTTTFAGSLAAFYNEVAIGHVEAGLRTWQKYSPFPEEMNRQMTGTLTDLHFAPTDDAAQNLRNENKPEDRIVITGNTAIDALKTTVKSDYRSDILDNAGERRVILLTAHRRENIGQPMHNIFSAIRRIVDEFEDVEVVYPMHKNPKVREIAAEHLSDHDRIQLIEPLDVIDFHNFASRSHFILTDSGGVQEEAPSLGKPVLVLRDTTERPEGVKAGTLKLAGVEEEDIYQLTKSLLTDEALYQSMSKASNPYGDGETSQRICEHIKYYFSLTEEKPAPFKVESR
ncbi:non-hydrolyzing UDP-N-acetylglucosamine 2-epimerase [Macrococcoides caseolyticum]|uniref:UDP-N-acetylglucosamine 2-epimerase (non-hydrolyzing) n=1 Tax=Macrococcoides caseolyticum TaxID=69966 RepID=A0A855GUU0_9STAP|nr:UDP-N-acetylglucosamine 2-epimerase (non-hydrolyzing) [Macrococcus caseolyticus]PKE17308.1 UDP-N-acetylglucosamine 2-epimerase (non-hydrolyzing) [Macrococcus caseolyticus]PKE21014.1 UDP-N-acetylglucosamine 2-epimerase (non-hydrolyzing) [Macrococcus caseolyticus]PKE25502.1 UDP-N-acetylglucosamine 2-epimerase (non-hydrolyzing) [Macrococcus caseolyticus]PKE50507.1 UDP-N-acetylglucosamine 2-epimerase (non-hydrolyzing) [Macrococcus caseolyticus]PKE58016.1 UDP-N-acetylglucosamine 2-epimerase (non